MADCIRCGEKIGVLTGFVHHEKGLCFDCIREDERAAASIRSEPLHQEFVENVVHVSPKKTDFNQTKKRFKWWQVCAFVVVIVAISAGVLFSLKAHEEVRMEEDEQKAEKAKQKTEKAKQEAFDYSMQELEAYYEKYKREVEKYIQESEKWSRNGAKGTPPIGPEFNPPKEALEYAMGSLVEILQEEQDEMKRQEPMRRQMEEQLKEQLREQIRQQRERQEQRRKLHP